MADRKQDEKLDMLGETILRKTMDLHAQAEKCAYILRMVESRVTRNQYRLLLGDLHLVYNTMEEEAEKVKDDHVFGVMYCPDELNRTKSLEQDLTYFYGSNWRKEVQPTDAALRYADHIRHIAETEPSLLLAHAYVRYLGDLSGGQILKFKMAKCMLLPENGEGTRFYEFLRVRSACRLKNYLMGRVNNLELEEELYRKLIHESRLAFQMNIDMFEELEGRVQRLAPPSHLSHSHSPTILVFEKLWQASTVVLSFAVVYNLSKVLQLSI